jgi:hypothetical protein
MAWSDQGWRRGLVVAAAGMLLAAGCSESSTGPEGDGLTLTHTVDTESDTVFVSFGTTATNRVVADYRTSPDWDLGFSSLTVLVNGGATGPGGVTLHCICQNGEASDEAILAMTPGSELADFEAVTAADIPTSPSVWSVSAIADNPWYRYDILGDHHVSPTYQVYLMKRGDSVFKIQLIGYYGPGGERRQITFRYARLTG